MRKVDAYLAVSHDELREAVEAMSCSQKRELWADWDSKFTQGFTTKAFKDWAIDYVEDMIQRNADAANRSYY